MFVNVYNFIFSDILKCNVPPKIYLKCLVVITLQLTRKIGILKFNEASSTATPSFFS